MIRTLLLAAMLASGTAAIADTRSEVLAAVDATFLAINANNAELFEKMMLPGALIVAQNYSKTDDKLTSSVFSVREVADRMRKRSGPIDERRTRTIVQTQRDLAHVWVEYTLDVDGKRLHCGVDSFGLVRKDGAWRVSSLTWTAEPNGCPK